MTDSAPLVSATGVHQAYGDRTVLRGVDLSVRPGELVTVVGPNGTGKSTLLRVLLGLADFDGGQVELGGKPLGALSRREVARLAAFVPQGLGGDHPFSVREIVAMGRTPHLGRFRPESRADRQAIEESMAATEVADMAGRPFAELSGGERQRTHLARAFAQGTPLLVLDEPNANLDVLHGHQLLDLVRRHVSKGRGAIVALHDLSLAARFSDRVVVLEEGQVFADGAPTEVITDALLREVFGVRAHVHGEPPDLCVHILGPFERSGP